VLVDGEKFRYREVDAPGTWEAEALLAANKHSGDWDQELLKLVMADFPEMDLALAGFEELVMEPISDAKYVRDTPQTTEQIPVEKPTTANIGAIQEKTEVEGKRIVIIIDCPSPEVKEGLKEKLRPSIEEAGAKIF